MKYLFFGQKGINEFITENGFSFYFEILHNNKIYSKFFYNVGQPDQNPPIHYHHKNDISYCDNIFLEYCSLDPFYTRYEIFNNIIEIIKFKSFFLFRIIANDFIIFKTNLNLINDGNIIFFYGIELDKYYNGIIYFAISEKEINNFDVKKNFEIAFSNLPSKIFLVNPLNCALFPIFYNISYNNNLKNKIYVMINKCWAGFMYKVFNLDENEKEPLIFAWDGAFSSIILSFFDIDIAKRNLFSVLEGITNNGMIPQLRIGNKFSNITNPPIWFLAAKFIFDKSKDLNFLKNIYPLLLKNYNWFKKNRMNYDYSFSWGIQSEDNFDLKYFGKIGPIFESGMDDSPIFDEMELKNNLLNYKCIDLTSLMILNCEIMMEFSEILGEKEILENLKSDMKNYSNIIHTFFDLDNKIVNSYIINENKRIFVNELTPIIFYPMLTSLLNKKEIELLTNIFNSEHFKRELFLPSLSFKSKYYNGDGDYWRGRIWPPMVFLTAYGFKKYNKKIYNEIRNFANELILKEWIRDNHIHENYSSITGYGENTISDYARSCPLYSWGGLLGII